MRTHKSLTAVSIILLVCLLCALAGCDSMRFAPTEAQKQSAELTHALAAKINAAGTAPASPASQKLCEGTRASLAYTGRPSAPPDPEQFDTIAAQANTDAESRPTADDVFADVESGLSLAAELAILFGVGGAGVGGKKLLDWVRLARQKNQAFAETVRGNELLKDYLKINNKAAELEAFKQFQQQSQLGKTPELVATMRLPIKSRIVKVPSGTTVTNEDTPES